MISQHLSIPSHSRTLNRIFYSASAATGECDCVHAISTPLNGTPKTEQGEEQEAVIQVAEVYRECVETTQETGGIDRVACDYRGPYLLLSRYGLYPGGNKVPNVIKCRL